MRTRGPFVLGSAATLVFTLWSGLVLAQASPPKDEPPAPASAPGAPAKDAAAPKATSEAVKFHLEKATKLYEDGAYEAALIDFERAYELSGNYKVLYNLGIIGNYLRDYSSSLKWYREYLAKGGDEVPAARKKEVQKEIDRLSGLVAKVLVVAPVEGAQVAIDDVPVGKTPLDGPVVLNPGRHRIALSKEGFEPSSTLVTVSAGDSSRIEVPLAAKQSTGAAPAAAPPPPPVAEPAPAPVAPAPKAEPKPIPWPAWAVTAGLAVGATATGILALTNQSTLDDEANKNPADQARLDELATQTRGFSIATDVLGGLAIASAVVSIVLTVNRGSTAPEKTTVQVAPSRISLVRSF